MINYLTLCQGSKVIREEHNTGLKPYPCHMPLLHNNLSVIVFWLTFTQPQLIDWLADWLEADLVTDLLTSLLTNLLTNWLAYCFNYWLADWLTDCVADRMVDLLATILVTNRWNKTRFSWIFWKIFVHSLFSPLFSLKWAPLLPQCWATRILEHWDDCNTQIDTGKGENHTSVSRFVTSIVAHWLIDLTGWQTYRDSY